MQTQMMPLSKRLMELHKRHYWYFARIRIVVTKIDVQFMWGDQIYLDPTFVGTLNIPEEREESQTGPVARSAAHEGRNS